MKLFIVRKYVYVEEALSAIEKEKQQKVDDVWVDDDWKKKQEFDGREIGFSAKNTK